MIAEIGLPGARPQQGSCQSFSCDKWSEKVTALGSTKGSLDWILRRISL